VETFTFKKGQFSLFAVWETSLIQGSFSSKIGTILQITQRIIEDTCLPYMWTFFFSEIRAKEVVDFRD